MTALLKVLCAGVFLSAAYAAQAPAAGNTNTGKLQLSKWELRSSVLETSTGEEISKGNVSPGRWYPADVPTTVLNALVKNGVYPDPRIDMNNYLIPDISDEFNAEHDLAKYSYLPDHRNPWKDPYWFKTNFTVPAAGKGRLVWLHFNGINYRADVWVNGKRIVGSRDMAGMFLRFTFNITDAVTSDGSNIVAVKVYPVDHPGKPGTQLTPLGPNRGASSDLFKDLTLKISGGWDCALPVRDRNMGIYQDVYLTFSDAVDIVDPYIVSKLPLPDTTLASVTIAATLSNSTSVQRTAVIKGTIRLLTDVDMCTYVKTYPGTMRDITFEKDVELPANGAVTVSLDSTEFPQLAIRNPRLWWPNGYGEQYLHELHLSVLLDGRVSSSASVMFGIRQVSSSLKELNGEFGRIFFVNGRKIFNKGGWYQPDMLLDMNRQRLYNEARLFANANLNVVSTEDMPSPTQDFMDSFDKYGIMWWEIFYQCWTTVPGSKDAYMPLDHYLAIQCERDIILRYRNSASLMAWIAENENVPGPDLYLALKEDCKKMDPSRSFIASTSVTWDWQKHTPYVKDDLPLGLTDVGKPGYTWHPAPYYFDKINEVKDQMFRDELGIPSVPTLSSVRKFIFDLGSRTDNPIFPLDSVWAEHGAWDLGGYNYKGYDDAIRTTYGFKSKDAAEYIRIAQYVNGEGYRAMFEAANSRLWDITSGVMLWKLNSAAPEMLWQIYDWYLNPNAAYYFTKKACEPLHVQLNANDFQVSVINASLLPASGLTVKATVYDFTLKERWSREEKISIAANRCQEVFRVPQLADCTPVYFVRVDLVDAAGRIVSTNFYWESSSSPADFSDLSKLENVKLDVSHTIEDRGAEYLVTVSVKNPTRKLAFMNCAAIIRTAGGDEVLPTFWNDNFFTLFPGEVRTLEARCPKHNLGPADITVVVDNR